MRLSPGSWTGLTNISTLTDLYKPTPDETTSSLAARWSNVEHELIEPTQGGGDQVAVAALLLHL